MRVAIQRLEEARFLNDRSVYYTAVIYLAGYAVECALKALNLSSVPATECQEVSESFRGSLGHSFDSLKANYARRGGASFPPSIAKSLTFVSSLWSTSMRYEPGARSPREADKFLVATEEIVEWAKARL